MKQEQKPGPVAPCEEEEEDEEAEEAEEEEEMAEESPKKKKPVHHAPQAHKTAHDVEREKALVLLGKAKEHVQKHK